VFGCVGALGCSSTSEKPAPGPCGSGVDGCIFASVMNDDPTPFVPSPGEPDGKGTFYAVLVDACPNSQNQQFQMVSQPAVFEVDLTNPQLKNFKIGYKLVDPRFGTQFQNGETAYLVGFLDDNDTVKDLTTANVDRGDTYTRCVAYKMKTGPNNLIAPLTPCLLFSQPPYAFKPSQTDGECDVSFAFPDAGGDASDARSDAGDAGSRD